MNVYEYIWIYSIIQFDIYIDINVYTIYIYMNFVFFVNCNIVATHTYDGHTGFTFTWSFPAGFTSRNDPHNCAQAFFVVLGEVPTGFKHGFKKQLPKVFTIFHFKLIHSCSWIHIILVSHYLPVQTHHNGKEIENELLRSIVLLTWW